MTGAHFDFTGMTGLETNALVVSVSAVSGPVTSEQEFYLVEATDSVVISLGFLGANVGSLAGYFGTLTEGTTGIVDLLDTVPLPEPVVDMEGAEASLNFSNTVAADFGLHLDTVQFDQTLVNGDFIGSHDIPRAAWVNDQPVPSVWRLDLGNGSNFFDLLETFPQRLYTSGRLTLNPFGSVASCWTDGTSTFCRRFGTKCGSRSIWASMAWCFATRLPSKGSTTFPNLKATCI